jgi:hypothetical protein
MDDVVAPAASKQVPEDARAEDQRRPDPPATARVQLHARTDREDADSANLGILVRFPLTERQIRHVVPFRRQALGQVPVPALRSPDGVRVQAVVDEADPHQNDPSAHSKGRTGGSSWPKA